MPNLIDRIVLQPTSPRPGETVRVEVFDGVEDSAGGRTVVTINGVPGAVQYLQFPTAGQRRLNIRAVASGGESERQVVLLDVQGAPLQFPSSRSRQDIAMIGVSQSPTQPYEAILTLGSSIDTRTPPTLSAGPSVGTRINHALRPGSLAARLTDQSVLGRVMAENARSPVRVETRRLTRPGAQNGPTPASGARNNPPPARKVSVATIYDLTEVDPDFVLGGRASAFEPEYEWDFGDGTTQTTRTPLARHDYFSAIDHAGGTGQFVVKCHVKHAGLKVKRTLTIQSAYAMCKRTGTVVPHVVSEVFAHKHLHMLSGMFTVYNVEDQPMVLDRLSITPLAGDGDAPGLSRPFVNLGHPVKIAPRSSAMVGVNVPFVTASPKNGELRYDVKGFTALYAGTVGGLQVRCSAVFEVPLAEWGLKPDFGLDVPEATRRVWPWEIVQNVLDKIGNPAEQVGNPGDVMLDQLTGTLAVSLGDMDAPQSARARSRAVNVLSAVYAPMKGTRIEGLLQTSAGGQLLANAGGQQTVLTRAGVAARAARPTFAPLLASREKVSGVRAMDGPPPPGFVAEGQVCDPDNATEEELALAEEAQLACQLTEEVMDVLMPARWMNARKGDVILSPGGTGFIGELMLNVHPPQWYSHSGIMTRNYDEITHSTGSEARLRDHLIGVTQDGSDGFEPSVLKYMWPGAVRQTVQHSVEGEVFPDPEYPRSYTIKSFGPHTVGITHNDQMKMIPPLVLKPDPMQETPAVRAALHAIATDARNAGGRPGVKPKYHYRWYCYTDPTIGQGPPEGPLAGWAAGTRASVCSSFIWLHAKGRNAHLETSQAIVTPTDLEPGDIAQGAVVRPTTPDGLYTYSAEEREQAAYWLFNKIHNEVFDIAGWFGEGWTDAADDTANQFLNAFASDDADGKDSTEWQNVVPADAVSPDNMLWWDGPQAGGLYGYAEPAFYREPRIESYRVSRWKKVLMRGTIRGRVLDPGGNPVAGAVVGGVVDKPGILSGADGSYVLSDVGLGEYELKAQKGIDGVDYTGKREVNLDAAELVADITVHPPGDRYRLAEVFIDFWGRDYETVGDDEITDPGPEYFELELSPDKLINKFEKEYHWGGELKVEYDITVRLLVNNIIDVAVQGTLYEGTDEKTKDLDGQGGLTFQVRVGQTAGATLTITNTDEGDDDAGVLNISVKNVRNNN